MEPPRPRRAAVRWAGQPVQRSRRWLIHFDCGRFHPPDRQRVVAEPQLERVPERRDAGDAHPGSWHQPELEQPARDGTGAPDVPDDRFDAKRQGRDGARLTSHVETEMNLKITPTILVGQGPAVPGVRSVTAEHLEPARFQLLEEPLFHRYGVVEGHRIEVGVERRDEPLPESFHDAGRLDPRLVVAEALLRVEPGHADVVAGLAVPLRVPQIDNVNVVMQPLAAGVGLGCRHGCGRGRFHLTWRPGSGVRHVRGVQQMPT